MIKFNLKFDRKFDLEFVFKSDLKSVLELDLMTINSAVEPEVSTGEIQNFLTFKSAEETG